MPDWEIVADTYGDAVKSVLPLHRIFIAALGLLGSISIENQGFKSVLETMLRQPIAKLHLSAGGLLEQATVANIAVAIGLVVLAWLTSLAVLRVVFRVGSDAVKLSERLKKESERFSGARKHSIEELKQIAEFTDTALEVPRSRLRAIGAGAELAAGIGIGGLLATHWGNVLDLAVGVAGLTSLVILHAIGLRVVLAKYMGPALFRARLLGQAVPSPVDAT